MVELGSGEREEVKLYSGARVQGLMVVGIEGKAEIKTDSQAFNLNN